MVRGGRRLEEAEEAGSMVQRLVLVLTESLHSSLILSRWSRAYLVSPAYWKTIIDIEEI